MTAPIALTCGDPAGIGPEITGKAWETLGGSLPFFVIGDRRHFLGCTEISSPDDVANVLSSGVPLLHMDFAAEAVSGLPDQKNAAGVIQSIENAVAMTKSGQASAVCTNPISKQILIEGADFKYPGHTEFLASLGNVERSVMMLTAPELSVVPVTIHIPLNDVKASLTEELLLETLMITHKALKRDFGISKPRITVSGLNPHAGEGGVMGREEIDLIVPVLDACRTRGLSIEGPLPGDTMFHPQAREKYDVAICMYHDQALIPIKTLNFSAGVNVTLGLPFIRTSPDHGTAFGIAGKNIADPTSLIQALKRADLMVRARANYDAKH